MRFLKEFIKVKKKLLSRRKTCASVSYLLQINHYLVKKQINSIKTSIQQIKRDMEEKEVTMNDQVTFL